MAEGVEPEVLGRAAEPANPLARSTSARVIRSLAGAWIVLAVAGWGWNLRGGHRYLEGIGDSIPMCRGLPAYGQRRVAFTVSRVFFSVDPARRRPVERFFCAQYAMAPTVLQQRPFGLDALATEPRADVILDVGPSGERSPDGLVLLDEARRRGFVAEEWPNGIVFLRASR